MNLIKVSIDRPVFITMVTIFLIVVGALALKRLPVNLYPEVSYPTLSVRIGLSGAAPEEVEQLITKKLEDALSTIAGVKNLRSVSREGMALAFLEFELGADIRFQEMQVRAKVANIKRSLPEEAEEPNVERFDADETPIIELSVTGQRSLAELTKIAEDEIAQYLRAQVGVGAINIGGGVYEEVQINLHPEKLDSLKINAGQIVNAIRDFNRNDPVGKLEGKDRMWILRSSAQVKNIKELGDIAVARSNSGSIFLRDVATLKFGYAENNQISRQGSATGSTPNVSLDVLKQSGENTVKVSERVQASLIEIKKNLPDDLQIRVTRDSAELVRTNVFDVYETLIIAGILTIVVVLIFLGSPRATLTTGLALPSCIITTFAVMYIAGFSINVMTLLGLSLSIGILVDDAIVVRENIFRHMQMNPHNPRLASYEGTKEVVLAVLATTATLIAVFLPVGFMQGVTGQFFQQFALTIVFAVIVSTWDALTMAPMLSAYFANVTDLKKEWAFLGKFGHTIHSALSSFDEIMSSLAERYKRLLTWMLPRTWFAAIVCILALGLALIGFWSVQKSFLPMQLGDVFSVNLSGPLAIPIKQVDEVSKVVEKRLQKIESLEFWTVRASSGFNGSARVQLTLKIKREFTSSQNSLAAVREEVRQALGGIVGYTSRLSEPSDPLAGASGGGNFQPIAIMVRGADMSTLRELGRQIRDIMLGVPGISDVNPIDDEGLPELRLVADADMVAHYGLSPYELSRNLRIWVEGDSSQYLRQGDDQIPIRIRFSGAQDASIHDLLAGNFFTNQLSGQSNAVPLGNVVKMQAGAGPTLIGRENRQRVLRIGASLAHGAALGSVNEVMQKRLSELPLPSGYNWRIVGQSEKMDELNTQVLWAILLGAIFVYMILAALFESYLQPLAVMMAIPLAATGAVLALLVFGRPIDLYAGIGMILLAGLVAKNSILLIDFAMQRIRDKGMEAQQAVIESAPLRLRPILMTSLATVVGMLPVALGLGSGGAARMGLGLAAIGGMLSSTLLTLLVVPNTFVFIEKLAKIMQKWRQSALV
ncbi:MAG: efflux RND transporter permease subunit [Oligoflexales bacterium]|nr:efflux RND transporter permease subunit [Oligoflexales bacterium]